MKLEDCEECFRYMTDHEDNELCGYYMKAISEVQDCELLAKSKMRIKCAAIRYKDKIYEGESHCRIGIKMVKDGVCPRPYPGGENQGFVTECGKYVRRAPALMIAITAGQVVEGETYHANELFSEDLRDKPIEDIAKSGMSGVCVCGHKSGKHQEEGCTECDCKDYCDDSTSNEQGKG